ncbi:sigma 54-interacting transcriptional regulator [Desulfonatronovibrio magnus]|uniref:sigma 54-interacting transcriptional regulator n=1 Tax=Desulfonatronovibrio magnus TaxID=698827 RepID=UPI0012F82358|nr:sigma 54-interacting transcriptional regulator [Desulfonatronovibrio magnus]
MNNNQQTSPKPVVLIVDDHPASIEVLGSLLREDYHVLVAAGGVMALEMVFGNTSPDLILLDIMMPDMDGYEVCRRLKADERTRGTPVIFVTAMDQDEDEELGFSLGAADYITKPFKPSIVRARVRTQINLKLHADLLEQAAVERRELLIEYDTIFNNVQSAFFLIDIDPQGRFIIENLNAYHQEKTGLDLWNIRGKTPVQAFGPELGARIEDNYRKCFELQQNISYEESLLLPAGERTWLSRLTPVVINGRTVKLVGSALDITDLKNAQTELLTSQSRLSWAQTLTQSGVWEHDMDQGTVFWSKECEALFGLQEGEFEGTYQAFLDRVHPDDREYVISTGRPIIEMKEGTTLEYDHRIVKKDGQICWVSESAGVVHDEAGDPLRVVGFVQDITQRKEAERAINKQKALEGLLMELAADSINAPLDDFEHTISRLLEAVGRSVEVDRVYLFNYDYVRKIAVNTHEWCAEDINPEIGNLQAVPFDLISEFIPAHERGESVHIPDVDELIENPGMRSHLEDQGIKSIVSIPLMDNRDCLGFVGFDAVRKKKIFSDTEMYLLSFMAQVIVNLMSRLQASKEHQESEARCRVIAENIAMGVAVIDENMRITSANPRLRQWFPGLRPENTPLCYDVFCHTARKKVCKDCPCIVSFENHRVHQGIKRRNHKGDEQIFRLTSSPVPGPEGRVSQVVLMFQEITDEVLREEELRNRLNEAENRLAGGGPGGLCGLRGASRAMGEVYTRIRTTAGTEKVVLLMGETGTGKELAARAIHELRGRGEFMAVNCANLSPSLLESELFGHCRGAFTGASSDKKGLFEAAGNGIILLDEIEAAPSRMQTALLRVLESREVTRVGDSRPRSIGAKVLAAANQDLEAMVEKGRFRDDLFYRLCETVIHLPPLRVRAEDISTLAHHFLDEYNRLSRRRPRQLSPRSMELLCGYNWPGNVRELRNLVHTLAETSPAPMIRPADLPGWLASGTGGFPTLGERERKALQDAMDRASGNKTEAARLLGVSRKTVYSLMNKYGLDQGLWGRT